MGLETNSLTEDITSLKFLNSRKICKYQKPQTTVISERFTAPYQDLVLTINNTVTVQPAQHMEDILNAEVS